MFGGCQDSIQTACNFKSPFVLFFQNLAVKVFSIHLQILVKDKCLHLVCTDVYKTGHIAAMFEGVLWNGDSRDDEVIVVPLIFIGPKPHLGDCTASDIDAFFAEMRRTSGDVLTVPGLSFVIWDRFTLLLQNLEKTFQLF